MVTDRDVNGSRNIFIKNALEGSEGPTLPSDFATLSLLSRTPTSSKTRSKLKKESASEGETLRLANDEETLRPANDEETLRMLDSRI
jgi:hypothetical protein